VLRGGEVIAEGIERTRATLDPGAHAEVEAMIALRSEW
jgi:tRNA(Arg) A34 adenosine deaminase TadA